MVRSRPPRTTQDTPDERFADYARLFERALLGRERREGGVVLAFNADGGTREAIHPSPT